MLGLQFLLATALDSFRAPAGREIRRPDSPQPYPRATLSQQREDAVKRPSKRSHLVELRTRGGLSIEANGTSCPGAPAQRKTLALLALLAPHPRGFGPDKLSADLGPEAGAAQARR